MDILEYQTIQKAWQIHWIDPVSSNPGVANPETLWFSNGEITLDAARTQKWATGCQTTPEGLTGTTADGRSFLIRHDAANGQLTCYYLDATASREGKLRALILGILAGSFSGLLAGMATGRVAAGTAIGLIASAAALITELVIDSSTQSDSGASGAVWVAESGSGGNREVLTYAPRAARA